MKIILFLFAVINGEFFSSMGHLSQLMEYESGYIEDLKGYIYNAQTELDFLRNTLDEIENERKLEYKSEEEKSNHLKYPLNQFRLIRRFDQDWPEVNKVIDRIKSLQVPAQLELDPSEFIGAAEAITRLSNVYNVPLTKFASEENINHFEQYDLYLVGKAFYNEKKFPECAKWMQGAIEMENLDPEAEPDDELLDLIYDYGSFCFSQSGNEEYAYYLTEEIRRRGTYQDMQRIKDNSAYYYNKKTKRSNEITEPVRSDHWKPEERDTYESLCRGETDQPEGLICYYHSGKSDNYYLKLGPVRTEELFKAPYVVRFLDVYSDDEMNHIKNLAVDKLNRATVFDPKTHKLVNADYRVSKTAWLTNDPIVEKLNRRISIISGVDHEYAEDMQMSNYGIGGQYEPHYDFSRREKDKFNNRRIATWLAYLTDVEQGGGTAFLDAKITPLPIKGSAVFWYNLLKNGQGDFRTRHAACPVLIGNKWVSNKWTHEFGNEFVRPCDLDENSDNNSLF